MSATCGFDCFGADDVQACLVECIIDDSGFSQGCATCFALTIMCTLDNCLTECMADPTSDDCAACQEENCMPDFMECSGLDEINDTGEVPDTA